MISEKPEWVKKGYIPCLDGLRAIAIFIVLQSHLSPQIQAQISPHFSKWYGPLGVIFFFVISGFLITLLMLREYDRTGKISLKDFYIRRVLRIIPPLIVYLLFVVVVNALGFIHLTPQDWLASGTLTVCFLPNIGKPWEIGHLWSLSVEEHFYIIWPFIFFIFKPIKSVKILAGYLFLVPLLRYVLWHADMPNLQYNFCSPTQMGSIAIGCLAAFMVNGYIFKGLNFRIRQYPNFTIIWSFILLILSLIMSDKSYRYNIAFKDPVNALAFALLMISILYGEKNFIHKVMNHKLLTSIGVLSYSIYLWQQPFTTTGFLADRPTSFVFNILIILVIAIISRFVIEIPFIKLKAKFV